MKLKLVAFAVGAVVIVGGGYAAYDYYAGNHVAVQNVIPANASASAAGGAVEASKLDGQWNISPDSKVYFSVTTSKETVNFEGSAVKGSWTLHSSDPSKMKAEAALDLKSISSGNSQRDEHVRGEKFLNAAANPEAKFTLKSIENFPKTLKEGEKVSFDMTGTLTVNGKPKDVTFKSDAVYSQDALRMEGSTVVTFEDFGLKNPHAVVVSTENNVTVQLRLILKK